MGSAPSSIQSGSPGRTAAGNRASLRAFSNRESTIRAGCAPDGPAEGRAPLSRSPRAHLATGASAPRRPMRGICSPHSNSESTMRRASPSRLPRRHWATGASAPRLKTRGVHSALSNCEPTMRRASASRASAPRRTTRGICSALSNRELLGLEILQLAENKRHRPVLIANFEPFCAQRKQPIP